MQRSMFDKKRLASRAIAASGRPFLEVRAQKLETLKRALARGLSEDLGEEDIFGLVLGFEAVAADGGVVASQVTWFPGCVQRAEGVGNVLGEVRAGGGVDGIGANEAFEIPEVERGRG